MSTVAAELLRAQFKSAHDWLDGTFAGITSEEAHWAPDGLPSPIGAQFMHVVATEDFYVSKLRGQEPLMATRFAGATGASELPPQGPWRDWSHAVRVDVDAAREYAQAVYAATDSYLASLDDNAVAEELDLSAFGLGTQSLGSALSILLLNAFSHTGEISALKGLQGAQGYPF